MKTTHKILRVVAALAMVATLSACGVKSSPSEVDGTTYPRIYPAPTESVVAPAATDTRRVFTRSSKKGASGVYSPPPPATEIQAQ